MRFATEACAIAGKLRFRDEVEAIRAEVRRLRDRGVNKIIALGHAGFKVRLTTPACSEVQTHSCALGLCRNCPVVAAGGHEYRGDGRGSGRGGRWPHQHLPLHRSVLVVGVLV